MESGHFMNDKIQGNLVFTTAQGKAINRVFD